MSKEIKYGSHTLDMDNLVTNLRNNVSNYLDSQVNWSQDQKDKFKNRYEEAISAFEDSNKNNTDRFSIDEFGTLTDNQGIFDNGETYSYDKNGNLVNDISQLSDKKKAKLSTFNPAKQVQGYINTIARGIVKKQAATTKSTPSFSDYWQQENDPNHELTDPTFWAKLDEEGKYNNRIKNTLDSLDAYTNKYKLSDEQLAKVNKFKEILQSTDAGSETWKRSLLAQAARMGLANWTNGYFGLYSPETTQKKEITPGSDDYFKQIIESYKDSTDPEQQKLYLQYMNHPNLRDQILKRIKAKYDEEETEIPKQWREEEDNKTWNDWLNKNPWYSRASKRNDLVSYFTPTLTNNSRINYLVPESRAAFSAMINAFSNADRKGDFLNTKIGKSFKTTSGQTINIRNVGDALYYYQNILNNYTDVNGNKQNGWSSFDTFKDADGRTIYKLKNSEDASGKSLYMFFKNGKLYSYRTYPMNKMKSIVLKGQEGLKVYTTEDLAKAKENKQQAEINNPNTPEDTKRQLKSQRIPRNTGFTAAEHARIAGAIADIASLIASFTPVYGTAVSAGTGLGSTALNTFADFNDDSLSTEDRLKNLGMNLGMDVVGLVPGFGSVGKAGKITRNLIKVVPKVMTILAAKNALSEDSRKSFSKLLSKEKLTVHDWQNISAGLSAFAGVGRMSAGAIKNRYMKNQAKTGEKYIMDKNGKQYKVTEEQLNNIKSKKTLQEQNEALKAIHADAELDKAFLNGTWNKIRHWQFSNPRTGNVYDYNKLLNNLDVRLWRAAQESSLQGLQFKGPGKFMDKFYKNPAYTNQAASMEDAIIEQAIAAARQEAATNLAAGSVYQDLLKKYKYNAKYARANSAPGNEDNYNFFKDQADDLLRQLRGMSPEYKKLRDMVSKGKITFDNNGNSVVRNWSDIVSKYGLKYKKGGIIKALTGTKTDWRLGIPEFDANQYETTLDTSKLYSFADGKLGDAWSSNKTGIGTGRYVPTAGYTREQVQAIQNQKQYQDFTKKLLDDNGNFTEVGKAWAKAVDALLPKDSTATFFDTNGNLRTQWTANNNDPYGRKPQTFTNLRDYLNYLRTDDILGARHNIFGSTGKRYYYKNDMGQRVYVNPADIAKYKLADTTTTEFDPNNLINWTDQEIIGLSPEASKVDAETGSTQQSQNKTNFLDVLKNISPTLTYGIPRALALAHINRKNAELLKVSPLLKEPLSIHRNTYNGYNDIVNGYNTWAQLRRIGANPYTSDASLNLAARLETNARGAAAYLQGTQKSDEIARQSAEAAWQQERENKQNAWQVANANKEAIYESDVNNRKIQAATNAQNAQVWDTLAQELEKEALTNWQLKKARTDKLASNDIQNYVKTSISNPEVFRSKGLTNDDVSIWEQVNDGSLSSADLNTEQRAAYIKVSKVADDLLNQYTKEYYGIPNNRYTTTQTPKFREQITINKKGGSLDVEFLRAAAKDADRFYKTTKDFADRTERAIARLQDSKKKKKRT